MSSELFVQTIKGPTSGANANKVIIPSGQTLDASAGTLTPSAGQVIQVVSGVYEGANTTITSTSYTTTPLTATITPTSTSSKILIQASMPLDDNAGIRIDTTVFRGSTNIADGANSNNSLSTMNPIGQGREIMQMGLLYMDSPASTSALTYTIYIKVQSQGMILHANEASATIALMEIAG
jgi:hypothetical protein